MIKYALTYLPSKRGLIIAEKKRFRKFSVDVRANRLFIEDPKE